VPHDVLSAAQDEHEAEIIAQAGVPSRVTVATNMAGRGVDIRLDEGVAERGGLHVILTERHDARRIDRQLEGRCARQGDPGSTEACLSFEDPLLDLSGSVVPRYLATHVGAVLPLLRRWLFRKAQRRAEKNHGRARYELLKYDRKLGVILAFSGGKE
jgi:preprotein translocase subunit SecA